MTLLADLEAAGLFDPLWRIPLGAGGGRDNLIKDTAVAIALEKPGDRVNWAAHLLAFLSASKVAPGLYYRSPDNKDRNSVDNLIGTIVACKLLGFDGFVKEICDRGNRLNWTYSIAYPSLAFVPILPWRWKVRQDWYGRFPGFPPFAKLAAGAFVHEEELALFYGSVFVTCDTPRNNTSDKVLLWLEWQTISQDHWLITQAYKHWQDKMTDMYGTLDKLFEIYYGSTHSFTQASKGGRFS